MTGAITRWRPRGEETYRYAAAGVPQHVEVRNGGLTIGISSVRAAREEHGLEVLQQLADNRLPWLPVASEGRIVGGLGAREAVQTYKASGNDSCICDPFAASTTGALTVRRSVDAGNGR